MWIIDVQGPETGQDGSPISFKSFLLNTGATCKLGRASDCDIIVQLQKLSRYQMEITVNNETDQLELLNVGSSTFIYDDNIEFKAKNKNLLKLNRNSSFRLRSLNWKFNVYRLPNIRLSKYLKNQIGDLLSLRTDLTLSDDQVSINDEIKRVISPQSWINKIKSKEWETKGKLSEYILPETEKEIICLDDEFEEVVASPKAKDMKDAFKDKKRSIENQMIDIKPISSNSQFSLSNRTSRRNRKSQLDMMFDEMDDLEDVETYTSQFTQKNERKKLKSVENSVNEPAEQIHSPIDDIKEDLSNLSLKRPLSISISGRKQEEEREEEAEEEEKEEEEENIPPIKKQKTKQKSQSELKKQQHYKSFNDDSNGLASVFKKTKQLKMDKLSNDEKIFNDPKSNSNSIIKIKKFHVSLQGDDNNNNPKVYSNFNMSYESDPRWENRLNYSKFHKSTSGSNYNPIMDSTIKTIGFKNSSYKSDELQVNLNQNDDMIPDLDSMFPSERSNDLPLRNQNQNPNQNTRKRPREMTLFVESDYEDTQNNIHDSFDRSKQTNTRHSRSRSKTTSPSIENSNFNSNNYNTITTIAKKRISSNNDNFNGISFNNDDNYNDDDDNDDNDDDDTPVFKSRRI